MAPSTSAMGAAAAVLAIGLLASGLPAAAQTRAHSDADANVKKARDASYRARRPGTFPPLLGR